MTGDPAAIAAARTMMDRLGGRAIWSQATTMHNVEEAYSAARRLPLRSETWRRLDVPEIWGHSQSAETDRVFAWTRESGWRLVDGTLTSLNEIELQEWRGRWRGNVYVMYHRLSKEDPQLRLTAGPERRFNVHDAATGEKYCWFEVSAAGDITKWAAAFGSQSEEWVYGPLTDMGPIRLPSWGTLVDGTYRFRYLSATLSTTPPPVSFDPPRR